MPLVTASETIPTKDKLVEGFLNLQDKDGDFNFLVASYKEILIHTFLSTILNFLKYLWTFL